MDLTLTAVFEEVPQSESGGYTAYTEEIPGPISEGDTLDEARDNLRDAITVLVEANRERLRESQASSTAIREAITVSSQP
jgi:predicted RNase H-like HicB family nuclease